MTTASRPTPPPEKKGHERLRFLGCCLSDKTWSTRGRTRVRHVGVHHGAEARVQSRSRRLRSRLRRLRSRLRRLSSRLRRRSSRLQGRRCRRGSLRGEQGHLRKCERRQKRIAPSVSSPNGKINWVHKTSHPMKAHLKDGGFGQTYLLPGLGRRHTRGGGHAEGGRSVAHSVEQR